MMDKLEKSSGQTVVTLNEAKLLLERHDDLVIAVYDYWLNKRLNTVSFWVYVFVFCKGGENLIILNTHRLFNYVAWKLI